MRKTRNKEAHNVLLRQYIKEIENPDRHGFIGGKWVQSPYKGDDPNNRGYGIDVLQNKAAAKLTQGRQGKWLTEDEERMLRNKHIKDVNDAVNNHYYKYLRRTPLSEEKEIMATGLLYRGDHINGTKLAEPYYNGSNADFQKAVEDYYRSKNLNDRAWRSKEFMDAHKSQSPFSTISLESPYVPMEYVGYHPNEDYYYAGELPQVDAYGEHIHAEGGILYGNQEYPVNTPQEGYQQVEQADYQVKPRQWDDLSLSEKNAFIANAVQHGITNMEDIRNAYNELMQEQLNGNDSMDDMEDSHKFLKGGYKPSRYIKNFISHMEGSSMKTNRSFEAEAKDFWNALPNNVKGKITQEQADALYSYSYNVGAGNFKSRVVPALQRYFSGNGSVEDVQRHMYATKDNQLRGLAKRRAQERAMFAGSEVPVYYNEDYTPQYTNSQWRNSRLGPVTAKFFNISQGLGPVSNTSNTLGPVTSSDYMAQRNRENTEALANILYGSKPMTAFDAPQETTQETSGIDRYNEIQDLLSTPHTFANGGEKDSGVTSTNGLYHASPSEYAGILDSVTNNNPLEVTLPDTTVTASDPSNYRSYYDPNGFMDFANIMTLGALNRGSVSQDLGLIKDTYDAVRGKKSWKDVGLSAIMGNKGVFDNPYANLVLDFAVPMAGYGIRKAATPKFNSELDWSPKSWFDKYRPGEYDKTDIAALESHIPEYLKIEKKAKANGTWLKMPDGSTWQGDPRGWVMLQSKNARNKYRNEVLHHGENTYLGDKSFFVDKEGNNMTGNALGNSVVWTSTNPKVASTYGKNVYPFIIPKDANIKTVADAEGRSWNEVRPNTKTDDLVYPNLTEDNVIRINNVVDPGDKTISIISKATDFLPNETVSDYIKRKYIGDDLVLGQNVRRKSLYGNNGNFDLGNVNIYKGLIPIGVGLSDYTLFHQFNK